jgi:hypothetical protein
MKREDCRRLWGCRTVTYFVYDAKSKLLAPSKFCAYTLIPTAQSVTVGSQPLSALTRMTVERYVSISDGTHLLDGGRAQTHLTERLGMVARPRTEVAEIAAAFESWLAGYGDSLKLHPQGPIFLCAPAWFL